MEDTKNFRRKVVFCLALMVVGSCGTARIPASASSVERVKSVVAAVHNGLYLPTMEALGQLYDAGNPTVVAAEPRIQAISEKYVAAKDAIDAALRAWSATSTAPSLTAQIQELVGFVGELEAILQTLKGGHAELQTDREVVGELRPITPAEWTTVTADRATFASMHGGVR